MQLRMLARRSLSGSMTVVGDIAQATGPWAPPGWDDVTRHLSPQRAPRLVELTVSYRTPAEVVAVCGAGPRGGRARYHARPGRSASRGSAPDRAGRPQGSSAAKWPSRPRRGGRGGAGPRGGARPGGHVARAGPGAGRRRSRSGRSARPDRRRAGGRAGRAARRTRPTGWSSTRSSSWSRHWSPPWATRPPARGRRWPRHGACGPSTWPYPTDPSDSRSCTPRRSPWTCG